MLKSLRHALRLLRKAPGFTLVSISSLAIGAARGALIRQLLLENLLLALAGGLAGGRRIRRNQLLQ